MPEVTIAQHKWRLPTDEFSPLCDNTLKLNNAAGLSGSPSKLNQFGVCQPSCDICISPYGTFGFTRDTCGNFSFMKKNADDIVQIPNSWQATGLGGTFILTRGFVDSFTANLGDNTNSLIPQLSNSTIVMRNVLAGESKIWISEPVSIGQRSFNSQTTQGGNVVRSYSIVWNVSVQIGFVAIGASPNCKSGPFLRFQRSLVSENNVNTVIPAGYNALLRSGGTSQCFTSASIGSLNFPGFNFTGLTGVWKSGVNSVALFSEFNSRPANQHSPWNFDFGMYLSGGVLTYAHSGSVNTVRSGVSAFGNDIITSQTTSNSPSNEPYAPGRWRPLALGFSTIPREE